MRKLSFSLLGVIIVLLAVVTFVEKYDETGLVSRYIYGSWWFALLWGVLAVCSLFYMLSRKLQQNLPVFLLHGAFFVILAGALLTSLTSRRGTLHLRMHESVTAFATDEKEAVKMPFTVTLDTFLVTYYPGTNAAADYTSRFTTVSPVGHVIQGEVAMNHVFSRQGFRFYQTSYDSDEQGSILTVNYDPWGMPVTYAGYFLLFVVMGWNLLASRGYLRRALNSPILKQSVLLFVLLGLCGLAPAAPRTLTKEDAAYMGRAQVLYNGRIAPLQTLASDFTLKLTGNKTYKGYTSEQVFMGWLLFPSSWQDEPMIRIQDHALLKALNLKAQSVSLKDFFTARHEYRLESYLKDAPDKLRKAAIGVDEKVQLITMLHEGELFKVFPVTTDGRTLWYAPTSRLPMDLNEDQWLFVRKGMSLLTESVLRSDQEQIRFFISKLIAYQQKNGGESVLSDREVRAEWLYNSLPFSTLLYRTDLAVGLLAFFFLCFQMLCPERRVRVVSLLSRLFIGVLWFSFLMLTFCLVLRAYISGRLPMGNGYETMMLMAWCMQLIAILFARRFRLMVPFGLLLSGFCLLVSSIGQMNPQITPLVPVLSSPLLSLHVSFIMMSYALFSFTFLSGLLALLLHRARKYEQMDCLFASSKVFLVPALFLLGAGIFIGAIWANVSWGRYWAWDAKEVWALITFLVYAFALHGDSLPAFRKPLFFHAFMVLAFVTILMTYFGVNYFLGGLHSYAG